MTEKQRQEHTKALLKESKTRAEAFHALSRELLDDKIEDDDFVAMSEALGFPIEKSEEDSIYESLMRQLELDGKAGARPLQRKVAEA